MQAYYVVGLLLALAVAVYGDTSVVPHSHCVPQRAAQLTGRVLDQVNQIRSTAMYEGRRFASFCPGYANTVVHNGKKYATLHDASPSSSDAGCEHDSYRGIQGPWWFAPNDADSQAVIAAYPWGTDRMVLSDRSSYNTQRYTGVHSCTDPLMTSGDQHKVGCCSYRILLRCDAAAEEAAQRHREEKAAQRRREEEQAAQRRREEEAALQQLREDALAISAGGRFAGFCLGYSNTVVYNGKRYATLSDASPSDSEAGCENDSYRGIQGPGWVIAPSDEDSRAVAAAYPWGAHVMALADSYQNTQLYSKNPYFICDTYKVNGRSTSVLLRCDAAAEEAAQRHLEEEEAAQRRRQEEQAAQRRREEEQAAQRRREEEQAAQRRREEEQAAQRHSEEEAAQRRHEEEALEEVLEEAAQRRCEEEVLEDAAKRKAEETSAKAAAKKKADAEAAAAKAAAKRKAEEMSAKAAAKKKAEETSAKAATKKAMAEANEAAHTGSKASEAVEIATVEKVAKKVAKRKPVSQKTFKNATPVSSMIANESHNTTYNGKLKVSGLKHARASTVGKSVREVHCQWLR